ncbi:MAG TPA: Rrf2 family transcriptional regulator [Spirochaetia bacterium]|jgi:Rrf2 family iron-sulfur cluster assembly transcriptional regulator|nr:Rrf2 family transcriptional regulator [Spirochaetia bacterium]
MRITTKGRYALKAILYLAVNGQGMPISIKEISAVQKISPEFLEQLFFKLKKSGIISSVRGPGGGFSLAKALEDISVKDVFDAVGEGLDLTPCTSCNDETPVCTEHDECLSYDVWKTAADQIQGYFRTLTLRAIVEGKVKNFFDPAKESLTV